MVVLYVEPTKVVIVIEITTEDVGKAKGTINGNEDNNLDIMSRLKWGYDGIGRHAGLKIPWAAMSV